MARSNILFSPPLQLVRPLTPLVPQKHNATHGAVLTPQMARSVGNIKNIFHDFRPLFVNNLAQFLIMPKVPMKKATVQKNEDDLSIEMGYPELLKIQMNFDNAEEEKKEASQNSQSTSSHSVPSPSHQIETYQSEMISPPCSQSPPLIKATCYCTIASGAASSSHEFRGYSATGPSSIENGKVLLKTLKEEKEVEMVIETVPESTPKEPRKTDPPLRGFDRTEALIRVARPDAYVKMDNDVSIQVERFSNYQTTVCLIAIIAVVFIFISAIVVYYFLFHKN